MMKRENTFNKIYRSRKYKNGLDNFPYIVDIELTNHCNLNCKMCSRQIMTRDKGYISRDTFNRIMKQCRGRDVGIRFIRWGEPFLHPHILDFCSQVKDEKHPLHITTNGLIITETQMKAIVDMKVDSIIFSMQGINEEQYESVRGCIYNLFRDNIKKLVELRGDNKKPYIKLSCTVDEEDIKYSGYIKDQWRDIVDEVSVGITSWVRINGKKPEKLKYIQCREPYQKLGINWDGKVTACCADYDNLLTIGDINNHTIFWLWNHNKTLKCIRQILDNMDHRMLTMCKDCYPAYGNLSD